MSLMEKTEFHFLRFLIFGCCHNTADNLSSFWVLTPTNKQLNLDADKRSCFFPDAQVYNSHIAICLAGKKLFKCKYCPKQFSRRSGKLSSLSVTFAYFWLFCTRQSHQWFTSKTKRSSKFFCEVKTNEYPVCCVELLGNLQIHMLTCPGKATYDASKDEDGAGNDDSTYRPEPFVRDVYSQPDDWSVPHPLPRKKPRRPKASLFPKKKKEFLLALGINFFWPSASKSGRSYGVTSALSLSWKTPPPLLADHPTGWLPPPLG